MATDGDPDRIEDAYREAAAEVVTYPELTPTVLLEALRHATTGEDVLNKAGTLIRLPTLEGRKFLAPIASITANPNQPRTRFDEDKLGELAGSIQEIGQIEAIKVIAFSDGDQIGLFIVDGERRFRAAQIAGKSHMVVEVGWENDEETLHETSFVLNIQREGHTPIEIARALKRMLDNMQKKHKADIRGAEVLVSKRTGYPRDKIRGYLEFLKYPLEIQEMLHEGTLRPAHVLHLRRGHKKGRANTEAERLERMELAARELLEAVEGKRNDKGVSNIKDGGTVAITRRDISRIKRNMRRAEVGTTVNDALEISDAILKLRAGASKFLHKADLLIDPAKREIAVAAMRRMGEGQPPEVLRDMLEEVATRALELIEVAEAAVKLPPLEIPSGKPSFVVYIREQKEGAFSEVRLKMAHFLAEASDNNGSVITIADFVRHLGIDEQTINGNIALLRSEFEIIGLSLDVHDVRVKDSRKQYNKIKAYRLAWKKEEKPAQATTVSSLAAAPPAAVPSFEISVEAPDHLLAAAQKIADLLAKGSIRPTSLNISTPFQNKLGVRLVVRDDIRGVYIVQSNIHAFAINFGQMVPTFTQVIRETAKVAQAKVGLEEIYK